MRSTSRNRRIATIAVTGAVAGVGVARRRRRPRWSTQPDPCGAEGVVLPPGERRTVQTTDGASLSVLDTNPAGTAPIVLAHCWTGSMSIWAPVARRLVAAGHRVVLYDQRGHGDSTLGRDALTIDRLGNDLAELLRQLDITDAVVGGHSMGGMTIQASAAASPSVFSERVRAVALVSTAAHTGLLRVPRRLAHALIGDRRTDQLARRPLASGRRMVGEQVHEAHLRAARDAMLAVSGAARADCMVAMGQMDYRDTLPTIEVPVRILVGTRDALTPVVRARELVEGVPDGRLRVLDGLGHMLPLEAPDTVAATIIELADPAAAPSVDPAA